MGWFDYLMLIVLLHSLYEGVRKGFVMLAAEVISLFIGYWAAQKFTVNFVDWVSGIGISAPYVWWITSILVFVGAVILARWAGRIVSGVVRIALLGGVNKCLGVVASFLKTILMISILIQISVAIHSAIPTIPAVHSENSYSFNTVKDFAPASYPHFEKLKNNVR